MTTKTLEIVRADELATAVRTILLAIGEDPDRPGLRDTPARVANFWTEFAGYTDDNIDTVFDEPTEPTGSMIALSGVPVWSLCEHHLMPFFAVVNMAYIPNGQNVLGLSKLARIAKKHASRLQVQERMTQDIADEIAAMTASQDVAVCVQGSHTCMKMRGVKSEGTMTTSIVRGAFRDNLHTRAEFMSLVASAAAQQRRI